MAVKAAAGYCCGGRSKTHTKNGNAVLILQPTGSALALSGGWGQYIRTQARNANTVPAFPPFPHKRATARHDPWRPRYPHLTKQRGRHRMRWPCDAMRNGNGPTRPTRARPTSTPGSPPKKTLLPATVGHCEQVIYKCPRERGPICAQRNGSRGAATAGTGRGNRMGAGRAMRMACRRAGDWCRGWPRAIGAGAVGHGKRGGVAACVRKS